MQTAFASKGECARKRLVVLSIDPDRARPSIELVTAFFHETFHAIQKPNPDLCPYSENQEDSLWIHKDGATYFALETSARLAGISLETVWGAHMRLTQERLSLGEIDGQLGDPGIAEKGVIALRLLVERGELSLPELLDGSLFQGCKYYDPFHLHNIETAREYWSDYAVINGSFRFSEAALAPKKTAPFVPENKRSRHEAFDAYPSRSGSRGVGGDLAHKLRKSRSRIRRWREALRCGAVFRHTPMSFG
jgi:hypothetical protein